MDIDCYISAELRAASLGFEGAELLVEFDFSVELLGLVEPLVENAELPKHL